MSWDRLQRTYDRSRLVLVLGAGVSLGSGLPNWKELLRRVSADAGAAGLADELCKEGFPLPVVASVLEEHCGSRPVFVQRVRDALYRDFQPFYGQHVTKDTRRLLVDHVHATNPTLRAVASLCATRGHTQDDYTPNPRVRALVTFNLDSLLEEYVRARYGKRLLRTVDRASARAHRGRTNLYHMHGFLRFDDKAENLEKEAPDAVVLTEQNYFDFFNDPTSLFNYTFLYLLREAQCLFIGLSMNDENMRRLLHFSKKERLAAITSERRAPKRHEILRHFALLERSGSGGLYRGVEDSLSALGTTVLWVKGFDEIGGRLRDLYETAGDRWESVN